MLYNILVLKESIPGEKRVSLVPDDVKFLTQLGHKVFVESQAGLGAGFNDENYIESGAEIRQNNGDYYDLFKQITLLVRAKRANKEREAIEIKAFNDQMTLVGALDPFENDGHIEAYQKSGIKAYSIDQLKLPLDDPMNILASMSKIAGELALSDAMEKAKIEPINKALIIGTGVAGRAAVDKGLALGLDITVVSTSREYLETLKDNSQIVAIYMDKAESLEVQQELVAKHAPSADVIITSARSPGKRAPLLIPNATLKMMKQGSCIVDLALSEGGNVEGSHHDQTLTLVNDVIVTNTSGYPKVKPLEASIKWSTASRLFIEKLVDSSTSIELSESVVSP